MDRSVPRPGSGQSVRQLDAYVFDAVMEGYIHISDIQEALDFVLYHGVPMVADPTSRLSWVTSILKAEMGLNLLWDSMVQFRPQTLGTWLRFEGFLEHLLRTTCGFLKKARLGDLHLAGNSVKETDLVTRQRVSIASKVLVESSEPCSHREWRDILSITIVQATPEVITGAKTAKAMWRIAETICYMDLIYGTNTYSLMLADERLGFFIMGFSSTQQWMYIKTERTMNEIHSRIYELEEKLNLISRITDAEQFKLIDVIISRENKECSICFEKFGSINYSSATHLPVKMPRCGHCFGRKCIERWLANNGSCPVCRGKKFDDDSAMVQKYWSFKSEDTVWKGIWNDEADRRLNELYEQVLSFDDSDIEKDMAKALTMCAEKCWERIWLEM